jgi:hypothetical protein
LARLAGAEPGDTRDLTGALMEAIEEVGRPHQHDDDEDEHQH